MKQTRQSAPFLLSALAALSLMAGSAALAQVPGIPAEIAARGELAVGLESTYPPFNYQDENGNLVGFEVDFANELTKRLGLKVRFVPTQWDGILAALTSGRLDVVVNQVTITEERQKTFDFSTPYTVSAIQIVTRSDIATEITGPDSLSGRPVGAVLGTNYEAWLRENVPTADIRTYDLDATMYRDLKAGRIDAALNDRLVALELIAKSNQDFVTAGEPFAKQYQAVALRQDPEFKAALDSAIGAMIEDGTMAEISIKWFGVDVSK